MLHYTVSMAAPEASRSNTRKWTGAGKSELKELKVSAHTFIVVSTQGECDEEALENALRTDAAYVAFVASKTKAAKVSSISANGKLASKD